MKKEKRLMWSIGLLAFGYFVGSSNFVRDLELADPHLPWWDMGGWFYYSVLGVYRVSSWAAVFSGGSVFGLVVIGQVSRFARSWKSIWS